MIYQLDQLCLVCLDFALDCQGTRADLQLPVRVSTQKTSNCRLNAGGAGIGNPTHTQKGRPEIEALPVNFEFSYLVLDVDACRNDFLWDVLFRSTCRLHDTRIKINKTEWCRQNTACQDGTT